MGRLNVPIWQHDAYTLRRLQQEIIRSIKPLKSLMKGGRVVDLGAGEAPYRPIFLGNGAEYLTCDIGENPSDYSITNGVVEELEAASADIVVSFQVLEHVADLAEYLHECRRLLQPGGKLLLTTHGVWLYHPHPGDYRRWTRSGLELDLNMNGFVIDSIHACVGPLAWTTQFRQIAWYNILLKVGPIGRALSKLLCTLGYARMCVEDYLTPVDVKNENAAVYVVVAQAA